MQKIGDIPNTRADSHGEFTDGNVAGGVPPTILPAEWFNTIQRELMSVLSAADIDADSAQFNQVATAISKLISNGIDNSDFLQAANHLKEIKNAGPTAVAETLANLGLGDAAKKSIASNAEMQVGTADKLVSLVGLMSVFGKRAFTTNDYIRIPDVPGGLIIQFLTKSAAITGQGLTSYEMTLPVPFPTATLCILSTVNGGVGDPASASVSSNKNAANTSFIGYVRSTIGGQAVSTGHIAIGY